MAISTYHKENNKESHEHDQAAAFSWRLDRHHQSQWLQSTLTDLEKRKDAMLEIIQDDGDSFAKRVEMYYKKRPELVDMVADLCKSHRSLAENYDKLMRSQLSVRVVSSSPNCFMIQQQNESVVEEDRHHQWAHEVELEMSKLLEEQAEMVRRNNEKKRVIKEFQYEINRLMDENKSLKSRVLINSEIVDDDGGGGGAKKKHNSTRVSRFRKAFCIGFF